jgi:hypothetical protein
MIRLLLIFLMAGNIVIAQGTNRVNSSGLVTAPVAGQSGLLYSGTLAAGQTIPIPCQGTQFYLVTAPTPLRVKQSGGSFGLYPQGTGLQVGKESAFSLIEVNNPTQTTIAFQIYVGFASFIDKRLISAQPVQQIFHLPNVTPLGGGTQVQIPDLSGTQFADYVTPSIVWLAIQRVSLTVLALPFVDTDGTIIVYAGNRSVAIGAIVGNTDAFPQPPPFVINSSGYYSVTSEMAGGTYTAWEIYDAVAISTIVPSTSQ